LESPAAIHARSPVATFVNKGSSGGIKRELNHVKMERCILKKALGVGANAGGL